MKDKYELIKTLQKKMNLLESECAFLGNDINDLKAFKAVGLKIAVKDSYLEILKSADLILEKGGGNGAVRGM